MGRSHDSRAAGSSTFAAVMCPSGRVVRGTRLAQGHIVTAHLTAKAHRHRWLGTAVGIVVLAALLWRADLGCVLAGCVRARSSLVLILAAPVVGTALHTLGWWILFTRGSRPRFGSAFGAYLAAQTVDDIALGVLGEPIKVLAYPPAERPHALSVLVSDNLTQLLANGLFLFGGAGVLVAIAPGAMALPSLAWWPIGAVLAVVALTVVIARMIARRAKPPGQGGWGRVRSQMRQALASSLSSLRRAPWRFAASAALHLLGKAWGLVEIGIALGALGVHGAVGSLALAVGGSLGALAGAPIPGQLGALEASYGLLGAWVGVPVAVAACVGLLRRARSLAWTALGLTVARHIMRRAPPWAHGFEQASGEADGWGRAAAGLAEQYPGSRSRPLSATVPADAPQFTTSAS